MQAQLRPLKRRSTMTTRSELRYKSRKTTMKCHSTTRCLWRNQNLKTSRIVSVQAWQTVLQRLSATPWSTNCSLITWCTCKTYRQSWITQRRKVFSRKLKISTMFKPAKRRLLKLLHLNRSRIVRRYLKWTRQRISNNILSSCKSPMLMSIWRIIP